MCAYLCVCACVRACECVCMCDCLYTAVYSVAFFQDIYFNDFTLCMFTYTIEHCENIL